ncbi:hypothetical protein ACFVYC_09340 [Pseudarthrobacter sp. NPDC058329]|uniref:hypothetical protein n=1 Tax=Pseudarthrobacter sp. NPDC058329 TaxID=3346448 RepID=UPI0036D87196
MTQEQIQANEEKSAPQDRNQRPYCQPRALRHRFSCLAASLSKCHLHPFPVPFRDGGSKDGGCKADDQEQQPEQREY